MCPSCGIVDNTSENPIIRGHTWTMLGRYVIFALQSANPNRPIKINDSVTFGDDDLNVIATAEFRPAHWVAWLRQDDKWWCCNDATVTEHEEVAKSSNMIIFTQKV